MNTEYDGTDRIVLEGDAQLWNDRVALEADEISLFRQSGDGDAIGNVALREPRFLVRGESASLNLYTGRVELRGSRIVAHEAHLYGEAEDVVRDGAGIIRVRDVEYSFCAPNDDAWQMGAAYLKLDRNTGRGFGRNIVLKVKRVPVLWLPVVGFPVDGRRLTGFLWPRLKLEDNATDGSDWSLDAPFYWNIAPQQDLLLTPRRIAFRGNLLEARHRYLFRNKSQSKVELGYMAHDTKTANERSAMAADWRSASGQPWIASAYAGYASDDEYADDISGTVSLDDEDFPGLQAQLAYRGSHLRLSARLKSYTVADRDSAQGARPYRELPRIEVSGERQDERQLNHHWRGEYVYFERRNSNLTGRAADTGHRLYSQYALSRRGDASWGFIESTIGVDALTYALDRHDSLPDTQPSTIAPRASLDMGLNIARDYGAHRHLIQPRIKYLRVEAEDQNDHPNFDTGSIAFSFTQLFADRRFSGGDRIGDTDQVTLGLSNKLISQSSGAERVRLDIGQTFYLQDRDVTLSGHPDVSDRSPLVSEGRIRLGERWTLGSEVTLDNHLALTPARPASNTVKTTITWGRFECVGRTAKLPAMRPALCGG